MRDLYDADHSKVTITDSEFIHNSANHRGGVLDLYASDLFPKIELPMLNEVYASL